MGGHTFQRWRQRIADADHDLLAAGCVVALIVIVAVAAGLWKLAYRPPNGTDQSSASADEATRNAQVVRQAARAAATAREIQRQEAAAIERNAHVQEICDDAVKTAIEADVFRRIEDPDNDTRVAWVGRVYYPLEYEDKIAMIAAAYVQRFGEFDKTKTVVVRDVVSGEVVMTYRPN